MPDFSKRTLLPEKMDQPGVAETEIEQALRELERINKLLGGYRVIFNALAQLPVNKKSVTIIDLGCGGGDMLRAISKWAKKKNKEVKLIGVDWNPVMTNFATEQAKDYSNIHFITMNVFDDALMSENADITMNSLFCHHFTNDELAVLVKKMYSLASQAVIVNDLHRHWFAYYSIKIIAMLFSKTYLVKYDGPLSVARSLNRQEWEHVLNSAGIKNYSLRWMWAWRWQLIIRK
ncbi:MAG: methyltransferase domain-containing protein [Bacteroidia bacterium]